MDRVVNFPYDIVMTILSQALCVAVLAGGAVAVAPTLEVQALMDLYKATNGQAWLDDKVPPGLPPHRPRRRLVSGVPASPVPAGVPPRGWCTRPRHAPQVLA